MIFFNRIFNRIFLIFLFFTLFVTIIYYFKDLDDDYEKRSIHCQLQYYSEITNCFHSYVSFNLCESTIQNVVLPNYKPRIIAAECWRIVLFEKLRCEETHDFKIDVR